MADESGYAAMFITLATIGMIAFVSFFTILITVYLQEAYHGHALPLFGKQKSPSFRKAIFDATFCDYLIIYKQITLLILIKTLSLL